MTTTVYIHIRNWDRFQHYKDRNPGWIKTYTWLMSDDDYLALSFHKRGILLALWLEYARGDKRQRGETPSATPPGLTGTPSALTWRLGGRVTRGDLEALNHAGFIVFSSSQKLPLGKTNAWPEEETETEVERKSSKVLRSTSRASTKTPTTSKTIDNPERASTKTPTTSKTIDNPELVNKLLKAVGPDGNPAGIRKLCAGQPEVVLANLIETLNSGLDGNGRPIVNRGAYVVTALKDDVDRDIPLGPTLTPVPETEDFVYVGVGDKQRLVTPEDIARYTGCEDVRGSHGISQRQNPLGTDKPLPGWPFPRPSRAEILRALEELAA